MTRGMTKKEKKKYEVMLVLTPTCPISVHCKGIFFPSSDTGPSSRQPVPTLYCTVNH